MNINRKSSFKYNKDICMNKISMRRMELNNADSIFLNLMITLDSKIKIKSGTK